MRGAILVLLLFLFISIYHYSRWTLSERENPPAFFRLQPQLTTIGLVDGRGDFGIYQFNDGSNLSSVIKLTNKDLSIEYVDKNLINQSLTSGELVKVVKLEGGFFQTEHSWLSARHRILLHISLHPDRMTLLDWEALPGIGTNLAQSIEKDRQKNGDFVTFAALKRVKGIGPTKLDAWREYFECKDNKK